MTCAKNPPPVLLEQDGLCTQGLKGRNRRGPLTATKTSAPRRGRAAWFFPDLGLGLGPSFFRYPIKFIEICKFNGFPWNFQKFRQNFSKISKKSSKLMEKIATNVKKLTKKSQKFDEKMEIRKRCKGVHCVDLGESFPYFFIYVPFLSISFQIDPNSNEYLLAKFGFDTAPRTSPVKFARSPRAQILQVPPARRCCWA